MSRTSRCLQPVIIIGVCLLSISAPLYACGSNLLSSHTFRLHACIKTMMLMVQWQNPRVLVSCPQPEHSVSRVLWLQSVTSPLLFPAGRAATHGRAPQQADWPVQLTSSLFELLARQHQLRSRWLFDNRSFLSTAALKNWSLKMVSVTSGACTKLS